MPVETQLREDGQIIHFKLSDPWTMEELFKGFGESTAIRDNIQQTDPTRRVHLLLDLMSTKQAPPGVLQGRKMPALTHAIRGEVVVAAQNEYPRSIAQTMLKIMRAEARFFDTQDDAWNYLRSIIQKPPVATNTEDGLVR